MLLVVTAAADAISCCSETQKDLFEHSGVGLPGCRGKLTVKRLWH